MSEQMLLTPLGIDGAWLATSTTHTDIRGNFKEWFSSNEIYNKTGRKFKVEQANISTSELGVLRGIHYSLAEGGQAKWITCVSGTIIDYVVDIRPDSPTFKKWISIELTPKLGHSVLVGEGLGHAFLSLEQNSTVSYLMTSSFSPNEEFAINPLDPDIAIKINFPVKELILSPKDKKAPDLRELRIEKKLPHLNDSKNEKFKRIGLMRD